MRNVLNSLTDIEKKKILEMYYKPANKKYLVEQGEQDWDGLGKPDAQPYNTIEIVIDGKKMNIDREMCKSNSFLNPNTKKEVYNKCFETFPDLSSDKQFFIDSYPLCCKYKDISTEPPKGKEWVPFDESKSVGYCFVKSGIKNLENGTEVGVMVSNDDTLVFTTTETQNSMSTELVLKFSENNYENMIKSGQLSPLNSKLWKSLSDTTEYDSQEEKYNNTLLPYFQQVVNNTFPVDSISKINSQGNSFAVSLKQIKSTGELGFDFWFDFTGKAFDEADYTDNRTKFQRYMDEYGLVTSLGAAAVGAILGIATGGATWALTLEILLDLGVGIASAVRDFEKGDNVSGFVNLISGGWSGARFFKYFRGISKSQFDELIIEMKNSGLTNGSSPDDIQRFIDDLAIRNPELAQVLAKASNFDELTFNQLQKALTEDIDELTINAIKKAVIDSPDKVFNVSFWKRLWVLDLKRQFGTIGAGLALELSPLGTLLNDSEKQKYQWVIQHLPDNKSKIDFDMMSAKNPQVIKKVMSEILPDIESRFKQNPITKEQEAKYIAGLAEIEVKKRDSSQPSNFTSEKSLQSPSQLKSLNYVEINFKDLEKIPLELKITYDNTSNYGMWITKSDYNKYINTKNEK